VAAGGLVRLGRVVALALGGDGVDQDGPSISRSFEKLRTSSATSWPSTGPTYWKPIPSKRMPGVMRALVASMPWRTISMACSPFGMARRKSFTERRQRLYVREANFLENHSESAPTLGEIDISLSFRTTMKLRWRYPAWFSPSKATPPVRAPSPTTDTTLPSWPRWRLPSTMPTPAETAVEACPTPKASCSDSSRSGKPASPPSVRMVWNRSRRPVRSLWA
jgi:hypothetical protein